MRVGRIALILGWAYLAMAAAQVVPLLAALGGGAQLAQGFALGLFLTAALGGTLLLAFRDIGHARSRQAALMAPVLSFATVPAVAALPLVISRAASPFDAYFSMVAAFTTTAASLMPFSEISDPVLLWRAEVAWIGGYASLLVIAAVLSVVNIGGMRLSRTAIVKGESGHLFATLRNVAAPMAWVYGTGTLLVFVISWLGGSSPFASLLCAFQGLSTAGYPIPGVAAAGGLPVLSVLVLAVAATNLTLFWPLFLGRSWAGWRDPEIRTYVAVMVAAVILFTIMAVGPFATLAGTEKGGSPLWLGIVHTIGAMTTNGLPDPASGLTGVGPALLTAVLVLTGGCTASTAGGLKMMRVFMLFRQADLELRRLAHPNRVVRLRYAERTLDRERDMGGIWQAFLAVLAAFSIASLVLAATGLNYRETVAVSIAALSNAGPAAQTIAPDWPGYASLDPLQRILVVLLMIAGRVEPALIAAFFIRRYWHR